MLARKIILNFYLVIIAGFHSVTQAQELEFEQLASEQALPSSEVYNLFEDKKGYIWACTEYGIVKHNGTRFIPVCRNIPFEESAFYVIRESAGGDLYLANSQARIYRVRNDSAFLVKGMQKISEAIIAEKDVIFDMLIDKYSNIYFSTLNASYLLSGNKVISLSQKYANDSGNTYYKKIGEDYALIKTSAFSGKHSFYKIIDEKGRLVCQVPSILYPSDRCRLRAHNKSFYFVNKNNLTCRNAHGRLHSITLGDRIMNFELSPDETIWIGTNNGLYQLDTNFRLLAYYLKGRVVSDILFDHRNGVWVSSIERGIYYCRNRNNKYYHDIEALSSKISLLKRVNNRFFIGTSDGNLFEKKPGRLIKLNQGNNTSSVTDITFFDGKYIFGTKGSTMILDHDTNLVARKSFFNMGLGIYMNSYGFACDSNALIFITPARICRYKNNKTSMLAKSIDRPKCIALRKSGEYLVGTTNGVFLLNDTSYYRPNFLSPLKNKIILNLLIDKNKDVWICTKGYGLYKLTSYNWLIKFQNIPSDVINNINIVNDTSILLSTDKGLYINALKTIDKSPSWKLLVNTEVTGAEIFDGQVFVATKQGLITINQDKALSFIPPELKFYLESITADNRKVSRDDLLLSHSENSIYFNFDILAYEASGYAISYELEGPDSVNEITTGRQLYLHKLQPGHYTLSAKPFYNGIYDQHSVIRIPFYIKPAFWQTRTFLVVVALSLIAIILIALLALRKKEKRKMQTARQLAEYRLTALKAQINPHFISNSLTAIQQLIIKNETDVASQYIAKFSLLLRYALKYSDKYVTYLSDEINLIGTNVELEQLRFCNQFIFEKDINENIALGEISVPPLITQPIIENAIWHGLLPLKNKRIPKLTLKVDIVDEKLIISIIDNGVGRQNTLFPPEQIKNDKESRGTWLIKNWIENLNQLSAVKGTTVNYIDLFDEENNPAGTRVDITFPLEALKRLREEKDIVF